MHSLRAQFLALLVVVVLGSLSLLAWLGSRTAREQFTAVVQRMNVDTVRARVPDVTALYRRGGWDAITSVLRDQSDDEVAGGGVAIDRAGRVVFATDSLLETAVVSRLPTGGVRLDVARANTTVRLELSGGHAVVDSAGDTVGTVFPLATRTRIAAKVSVDDFSSGVNRRLWLGVAALLALTALAGVLLTARILQPVRQFTAAVQRIGRGDYAARVGDVPVREFTPLAASIDALAAGLERSETLRQRMIRDIAHELRSPLTNLRGQIEALQDQLRVPNEAALASLHEESMLLERLVSDLDALARSDAGELELALAPVDLSAELRRVVDGFVHGGRTPASRLTVEAAGPCIVRGDRERLGQVMRNLIENALTHGASAEPVVVSVRCLADRAELVVADQGVGIAPEHLPRVFERLYRPDASRTRGAGGAGLGLAIVQALVEAQGGSVAMTSTVGRGTTVVVQLPRVAAAD